jgi:hypothetical protein
MLIRSNYDTKFNRDGSISFYDEQQQRWVTTSDPDTSWLRTLDPAERRRVVLHCRIPQPAYRFAKVLSR